MAVRTSYLDDRAVVSFNEGLTLESVTELVASVDIALDVYFYDRVEVRLDSEGGLVRAVDLWASALERWRACGVVVATSVVSNALSAAAIMFSLGDERVVARDARLLYHRVRVSDPGEVSVDSLARLHGTLVRMDSDIVDRLVDRAMLARAEAPAEVAFDTDEEAVRTLFLGLQGIDSMPNAAEERTEVLLRALGIFVDNAVRDVDRDALVGLYRAVFDQAFTLSGALARTLGLADWVARPHAPPARSPAVHAAFPPLVVPEWRSLFAPEGAVPRAVLTRHALILGETGSGKTASAILPILSAMARAPAGVVAGGLVIDPKRELGPALGALAGDALERLDGATLALNVMSSPRRRLDDDLVARRWVSAATKILQCVRAFAPASPLRVLGPHEVGSANSEFFAREGTTLLVDVLAFVLMLTDLRTPDPLEWGFEPAVSKWVEALLERARGAAGERGPNALALAAWALAGPLVQTAPSRPAPPRSAPIGEGQAKATFTDGRQAELTVAGVQRTGAAVSGEDWLWAQIAQAALVEWAGVPGEGYDLLHRVLDYWRRSAAVDRQHAGVIGTARGACHEFADPAIARTLYFGCERGYRAAVAAGAGVDFTGLVACDAPPTRQRFVLFQPARAGADALLAAALKASFFEAVLDDPTRQGARADVPLVGYVADEAHWFLTSDPLHGEQSFLDTARSFGAFCVLAAQSVASFEHALAQRGGGAVQNQAALSMVWTNTGTKFVFRTADADTARRVGDLCPQHPGLEPLTRLRPLSTLATGECYALTADGRVQRRRLEPFVPEEQARRQASEHAPVRETLSERESAREMSPDPESACEATSEPSPEPEEASAPALEVASVQSDVLVSAPELAAEPEVAVGEETVAAPSPAPGRPGWLERAPGRRRSRRGRRRSSW